MQHGTLLSGRWCCTYNNLKQNKIELLAPAGDLEKLKYALIYGADAVYLGGEAFSLRAGAGNFTIDELKEGLEFAHTLGKKVYLTLNIFPHNEDIPKLTTYLENIKELSIDGFIASDPGVIALLKEKLNNPEIHLSTQANMTNYATANFWYQMGIRRIVLARELSLDEIKELRNNIPDDLELEAFVHGAMCISYSGRCLLSNFMVERDANRGACAHPCRWKYALVEEKRPGEYYPIEEDSRGTYIMNSKDLAMVDNMGDLIEAGVASAKIEGRMKSLFYVATVVSAYRKAIDEYYNKLDKGEDISESADSYINEVAKVSNRQFTTGFYYDSPTNEDQNYESNAYSRDYSFIGVIHNQIEEGVLLLQQRNKFAVGDHVEIFGPSYSAKEFKVVEINDAETDEKMEYAPHPKQLLKVRFDQSVDGIKEYFIMRKAL